MGRRPADPHGVRGRSHGGDAQLRTGRRLRDLPRLARPLGYTADAAGRDARGRGRRPTRAGPHRHRPPGRVGHRRSATLGRRGSRPPSRGHRSTSWPPSGTTGRSWCWTCAALRSGTSRTSRAPCTSRCRTFPGVVTRCPKGKCGSTARAATALPWQPRSSPPPDGAWSPSTTSTTPHPCRLPVVASAA